MIKQWFIIFTVLLCYCSAKDIQVTYWDGEDPYPILSAPAQEECNSTYCDMPCPRSVPPPYCPKKLPECGTGCVCMYRCDINSITCFMTKYCKDFRRFLKKPPFVPRVTPENSNYYHF